MAGGPWTIENHHPQKMGCFRAVRVMAAKLAMKTKQPITVRFLGSKSPDNFDRMKSDFLVLPNGTYDFSIDPTWKGR